MASLGNAKRDRSEKATSELVELVKYFTSALTPVGDGRSDCGFTTDSGLAQTERLRRRLQKNVGYARGGRNRLLKMREQKTGPHSTMKSKATSSEIGKAAGTGLQGTLARLQYMQPPGHGHGGRGRSSSLFGADLGNFACVLPSSAFLQHRLHRQLDKPVQPHSAWQFSAEE